MTATDIIHAGIDNGSIWMYACNGACGVTQGKIDFSWKNVTCKNCLHLLTIYDRCENDGHVMFKDKEK